MEFAIVDIETTGGYAAGSGITEIAILIHDGEKVCERYETLVNPQRPVPLPIQLLTGIHDEMLQDSPAFNEIAGKVHALLSGRVFVAHSVNFDYSFIKYQLEAAGLPFTATKLCTVRLSRKVRPGLPSYSLGKLCDALDIPLSNRHRAGGDADATAILFSRLCAWDTEGHLQAMLKKQSKEQTLPPNLPKEDFDALPQCPGVYYFRDKGGKVIYVGKAGNIRKRISSHFTGHNPNPQRQHFLRNIYSIRYERCGTELFALLLEAAEIKRLWPAFNRAQKHHEAKFGLYLYEDLNGYLRLVVGKHNKYQPGLHVFSREYDARNLLHKLVRNFGLCPGLCQLSDCDGSGHHEAGCLAQGAPEPYNQLVREALQHLNRNLPSFIVMGEGRHEDEQSCIWVEQGSLYGMGYIDKYTDLQSPADIKSLLTPYTGNAYMMQLIYSHAEKHPHKVLQLAAALP
ncbi:exonuclease domain-containing protein [Taibaiella koreensis]|uniref:exonuclease domain-containing protein n=1 Tax=Taibaiella koreensis TaxID=1268548 RepID=UPI000E59CEF4|nr:exonuclease domain-containing protein [Taibaiella koreensis]